MWWSLFILWCTNTTQSLSGKHCSVYGPTIHLPVCLYALLTTCGDAPDGLQMVSRDLLPDLHRYITSHRGSTGLRSVEPEGINAFIIEELFHTGHMRLAIILHQDEPRAEC